MREIPSSATSMERLRSDKAEVSKILCPVFYRERINVPPDLQDYRRADYISGLLVGLTPESSFKPRLQEASDGSKLQQIMPRFAFIEGEGTHHEGVVYASGREKWPTPFIAKVEYEGLKQQMVLRYTKDVIRQETSVLLYYIGDNFDDPRFELIEKTTRTVLGKMLQPHGEVVHLSVTRGSHSSYDEYNAQL